MAKKHFLSLIMACGFLATETAVFAKQKPEEFKYKTKHGDVSRAFMSDIIGNTKGYLYDFAKNFKKHPELFLSSVTGLVTYMLYKDGVDTYVTNFVYGVKKLDKTGNLVVELADHRPHLAVATAALAAVAYVAKDKINEKFFEDEVKVVCEEENSSDLEEKAE